MYHTVHVSYFTFVFMLSEYFSKNYYHLGLNKNQYMFMYLLWRVHRRLHCEIEMKMHLSEYTTYVLSYYK